MHLDNHHHQYHHHHHNHHHNHHYNHHHNHYYYHHYYHYHHHYHHQHHPHHHHHHHHNSHHHHHRDLDLHGLYRLDIPSYLLSTGNLTTNIRTGVSTNAKISSLQLLKNSYKFPSGATMSDDR
jgi:hypothetical protein